MRFYQFHPGDYLRDTAHLTPLEDCIYRRALDWLYSNEKPLPIDSVASARLLRLADQHEAVGAILSEFLTETPEGWISNRANHQIEQYQKMQQGGAAGAAKRWTKSPGKGEGESAQGDGLDSPEWPSDGVPTRPDEAEEVPGEMGEPIGGALGGGMLTRNQKPITNNHIKTKRPASPSPFVSLVELVELGVDKQHASDWLAARKVKRLPLTRTAMQGVIDEAEKAGLTVAQAITLSAKESWGGFKASWVKKASAESLSFIQLHTDRSWREGLDDSFAAKYSDRSWADGLELNTQTEVKQ